MIFLFQCTYRKKEYVFQLWLAYINTVLHVMLSTHEKKNATRKIRTDVRLPKICKCKVKNDANFYRGKFSNWVTIACTHNFTYLKNSHICSLTATKKILAHPNAIFAAFVNKLIIKYLLARSSELLVWLFLIVRQQILDFLQFRLFITDKRGKLYIAELGYNILYFTILQVINFQ